jgi:hypothetical protein
MGLNGVTPAAMATASSLPAFAYSSAMDAGVGEVDTHVAAPAARHEDRVAALSKAQVHGRAQFS